MLAVGSAHGIPNRLMHDLLLGRTPIGDRVWDMLRLIDWAIKPQDVDWNRIAITGNSGGGTASLFAAPCDTRISVAPPGRYFNTFAGSIGAIIHCDCNYVPGTLRLSEMHDVAGLAAPRHFLAVAGRDDPIFPVAHIKAAFAQIAKVYRAASVLDRCELVHRRRRPPLLQGTGLELYRGGIRHYDMNTTRQRSIFASRVSRRAAGTGGCPRGSARPWSRQR